MQKNRSHEAPPCRCATSGAPVAHWRLRSAVARPQGHRAKGLAHRVAVGMALTGQPPYRSRRAELPHRAPALGQTRRLTACRIRSSALCRAARLCVRSLYCPTGFPLASSLPSSHSATAFDIGSGTADVRLSPSPHCVPSAAVDALFM